MPHPTDTLYWLIMGLGGLYVGVYVVGYLIRLGG